MKTLYSALDVKKINLKVATISQLVVVSSIHKYMNRIRNLLQAYKEIINCM